MLEDETTYISKAISYRTYEKPISNSKTEEEKKHSFYLQKKKEYSLPQKNNDIQTTENNIRMMMKRAKDYSNNGKDGE